MVSDGSGFQVTQDHPAVMTCLPITERLKRMSGLSHLGNSGKSIRIDLPHPLIPRGY